MRLVSSWDYKNQAGWGGNCASSDTSPFALDPSSATQISSSLKMKMAFLGYTGTQTIVNTGNFIKIDSSLGYIEVGDMDSGRRIFNVKQIVFHTPSEHKIGGTFFPMEIEIICTIMDRYWERDQPNLAIVSVIVQKGKESYFFNTLNVNQWPQSSGQSLTLDATSNINLREIVMNTDEYWFYNGTSSNPDYKCQGNVLRYLIQDVKEAAAWQIDKITKFFPSGSARSLGQGKPTLYTSFSMYLQFLAIAIMI